MEKAHTPGPWPIDHKIDGELLYCPRIVVGPAVVHYSAGYNSSEQDAAFKAEAEANARLIAAAPELLVELEAARDIIHNALSLMTTAQKSEWGRLNEAAGVEGEGVTRRHERDAVIAKATGKA